jgi:hypothetical protein
MDGGATGTRRRRLRARTKQMKYYTHCLIKRHLAVRRNNQLSGLQPVCLEAEDTRDLR